MAEQQFFMLLVIHNQLHKTAPVYYTLASVNTIFENAQRDRMILNSYGVDTLLVKERANCLEKAGDIYILKI